MIPLFDSDGRLPPGVYTCTWEENAKRAAQKGEYGGEFFPVGWRADNAGTQFLEFFQIDRDGNPKGIIAIDLERWNHD